MFGILWLIQHWLSRRLGYKSSYNSANQSKTRTATNNISLMSNGTHNNNNNVNTQYSSTRSSSVSSEASSSDEYISEELKAEFDSAAAFVRSAHDKLDKATLLTLYGCYKQATQGECTEPSPSWYEAAAVKKWTAWHDMGCTSKSDAMHKYIQTVRDTQLGWDNTLPAKPSEGFGLRPSRMLMEEGYIGDDGQIVLEDSAWFAAVKSGDPVLVKQLMVTHDLNETDPNGMSALHWACDRGHCTLVSMLLQHGIDYDLLDDCQQSALHYAASCDYEDIVSLLLAVGADTTIRDSEGLTPLDMATEPAVRALLSA